MEYATCETENETYYVIFLCPLLGKNLEARFTEVKKPGDWRRSSYLVREQKVRYVIDILSKSKVIKA
jgi:hypothetical protein